MSEHQEPPESGELPLFAIPPGAPPSSAPAPAPEDPRAVPPAPAPVPPAGENQDDVRDAEDAEETEELLSAIHEEVVAAAAENRRASRRVLEALKSMAGMIDSTSSLVEGLHATIRNQAAPAAAPRAERSMLLSLVDLADRVARIHSALKDPMERKALWPGTKKVLAAWQAERAQSREALWILATHLEKALAEAGVNRLQSAGKPFDPQTMTAVEAVSDDSQPDQTVLLEFLPGWQFSATGEILRPAQVRVSRNSKETNS